MYLISGNNKCSLVQLLLNSYDLRASNDSSPGQRILSYQGCLTKLVNGLVSMSFKRMLLLTMDLLALFSACSVLCLCCSYCCVFVISYFLLLFWGVFPWEKSLRTSCFLLWRGALSTIMATIYNSRKKLPLHHKTAILQFYTQIKRVMMIIRNRSWRIKNILSRSLSATIKHPQVQESIL